jgi:hypothetical protein
MIHGIPGAMCHQESDILHLSKAAVQFILSAKGEPWRAIAPTRAGWYLQQLLKLFSYRLLNASVAQDFLVWDADNIPIRRRNVYDGEKIIVELGGRNDAHQYNPSTLALIGYPVPYYDVVTHKMLVRYEWLRAMLERMCGVTCPEECSVQILNRIPHWTNPVVGLSEYALYWAWSSYMYGEYLSVDPASHFGRIYRGGKWWKTAKKEKLNASAVNCKDLGLLLKLLQFTTCDNIYSIVIESF